MSPEFASISACSTSPSLPAADTALSMPPLMVGVPWKLLACEKEEQIRRDTHEKIDVRFY